MPRQPGRNSLLILSAVLVTGLGCAGDGPSGPPTVSSVVVESPIQDVMAVGRSVQLEAIASDASGDPVTRSDVSWSSSDESVATVSSTGLVEGISSGTVRITADTDDVSGSLQLSVVSAELQRISGLLEDPFTMHVVSGLTTSVQEPVQTSADQCSTALNEGHILNLNNCLEGIQNESATDPTDRGLLAILGVLAQRAQQLLHL